MSKHIVNSKIGGSFVLLRIDDETSAIEWSIDGTRWKSISSGSSVNQSNSDSSSISYGNVKRDIYKLSLSNPVIPENSPITQFTVSGDIVTIKIDAGTSLIIGKMYLINKNNKSDCAEVVAGSKFIEENGSYFYIYEIDFDNYIDFSLYDLIIQTMG